MKLKTYIAINLLFFTLAANACVFNPSTSGDVWIYRIMPLDESNYDEDSKMRTLWESDINLRPTIDYSSENIRLWQKQTSGGISLEDIEFIVYKADVKLLRNISKFACDNSFARWIVKNHRDDIVDLLIMAKQNEEIMHQMTDPWYYRVEDDENFQSLERIANRCIYHKNGQLVGRYALQAMRALCNLRKYDECARYWDSIKDKIPYNVVHKMCELKAAAALHRIGRMDEALEIYARYGDVSSIRAINNGMIDNELQFVYDRCPNSPYLESELQKWLMYFCNKRDEHEYIDNFPTSLYGVNINSLLEVAHKAVRERKSKQMAMWYYTLAALYDIKGEPDDAQKYLRKGMNYRMSAFLRDSYRVMRMWLDAQTHSYDKIYEAQLEKDLRWLVSIIEHRRSSNFETEIARPIMATDGPAEYDESQSWSYYHRRSNSFYWNDALRRLLLRVVCPKMHEAGKYIREIQLANLAENLLIQVNDYSNEMFLIMDRLPYKVTRDYFTRIYKPIDNFDKFLNSKGRIDQFYWYDILATKCLRERRYEKAIVYLKQIPVSFQRKMHVYCYMNIDPFNYDMQTFKKNSVQKDNYKLNFALKMAELKRIMTCDRDADKRADAKIQYAFGLRNSVYKCWFLTRHSSNAENNYIKDFRVNIPYKTDTLIYRYKEYLALSDRLIDQAVSTYNNKEKAARQLKRLLYFRRIFDDFPETETANNIRQHCDRWKDYALNVKK